MDSVRSFLHTSRCLYFSSWSVASLKKFMIKNHWCRYELVCPTKLLQEFFILLCTSYNWPWVHHLILVGNAYNWEISEYKHYVQMFTLVKVWNQTLCVRQNVHRSFFPFRVKHCRAAILTARCYSFICSALVNFPLPLLFSHNVCRGVPHFNYLSIKPSF